MTDMEVTDKIKKRQELKKRCYLQARLLETPKTNTNKVHIRMYNTV